MYTRAYVRIHIYRALRWHDDWGHLRGTLEEQFKDMHREGPQRKKGGHVATEMSRIVHEVGDRNYNEGLAMAASALNMSVKLLILEWEFRCKWAHHQPARELPRASASRPSDNSCPAVRSRPPSKSRRPGSPRARGSAGKGATRQLRKQTVKKRDSALGRAEHWNVLGRATEGSTHRLYTFYVCCCCLCWMGGANPWMHIRP